MSYELTRRAGRDLNLIYLRGIELFGLEQSERYQRGLKATFDLLAANPRIARVRHELRRPVRLHPYQAHLVAYIDRKTDILIFRVLHGREDWSRRLRL